MVQTVKESGLVILGTKTSSADFATSTGGEALTTRARKKMVVNKDTKDMSETVER